MENASKALIMAGTILVSILILSIAVYLFSTYSDNLYQNEVRQAKQELMQYNNKFTKYVGQDLNTHDILTIVNLANDYNSKKTEDKMEVYFYSTNLLSAYKNNEKSLIERLEGTQSDIIFKIEGNDIEYYNDGTIKKINITKEI